MVRYLWMRKITNKVKYGYNLIQLEYGEKQKKKLLISLDLVCVGHKIFIILYKLFVNFLFAR